ncbi:MAG: hypothetical protein ACKO5Q_24600 [Microcystaceae cyanobacterium]
MENPLDLLILPSGQGIIKNPQGVRKSLTRTAWHGRNAAITFIPSKKIHRPFKYLIGWLIGLKILKT